MKNIDITETSVTKPDLPEPWTFPDMKSPCILVSMDRDIIKIDKQIKRLEEEIITLKSNDIFHDFAIDLLMNKTENLYKRIKRLEKLMKAPPKKLTKSKKPLK